MMRMFALGFIFGGMFVVLIGIAYVVRAARRMNG